MSGLPYEGAVSGDGALGEIQRTLMRFGAQSFGSNIDFEHGKLIVQFRYRDTDVRVEASISGYAAAWLRQHPWSNRVRRSKVDHEREAQRVASRAVYSILRDWIKGQITAVETDVLSFEGAFLGQILLPNGETAIQRLQGSTPRGALPGSAGRR